MVLCDLGEQPSSGVKPRVPITQLPNMTTETAELRGFADGLIHRVEEEEEETRQNPTKFYNL